MAAYGKCLKCGKEFDFGEWSCSHGGNHEVTPKTYFVDCTVSDPQDMRKCRHTFFVTAERRVRDKDGNEQTIRAREVEFVRGRLETSDPEIQWGLEYFHKGSLISEEKWKDRFFSAAEKNYMREQELKARELKIKAAENELLAKVKQEKGK